MPTITAGDIAIQILDLAGAAADLRAIFTDADQMELLITFITSA